MQLVGKTCGTCSKKVALATEGTFCVSCHAAFHQQCRNSDSAPCGACGAQWQIPESTFTFFCACAYCGALFADPHYNCPFCLNSLVAETEPDRLRYIAGIRSELSQSRGNLVFASTGFLLSAVVGVGSVAFVGVLGRVIACAVIGMVVSFLYSARYLAGVRSCKRFLSLYG